MGTETPHPADSAGHLRGIAITALGVVLLSFDAVLVRLAGSDGLSVSFWRGVFIALSLGGWVLLFGRHRLLTTYRAGWPALLATVLFGVTGLLFVLSVMHTRAANTVVIVSAAPLFAALFTWLVLREPVRLRTWLAIGVAFLGVILVFYGSLGAGGLWGDIAALATAAVLGANLTLLRRYPDLARVPLVAVSGVVMALLALPGAEPWSLSAQGYLAVAVMGLAQMPAAMVLMAVGTRYLPAPEVGLFLLVEAVLGPLWVWLAVGEEPPEATFLGGGLILATLAVHSWLALGETRRVRSRSVRPVE
ncbi:MAG: DMT family transporter [Candidatus Competibacteraceae bacterium]|nr:DMT family transporter [Candidatus Competibacteraceae bacterium]